MKATLLAIPMSRSGIIVFMKKVEKTSAAEIHPAIKSHIGHLRLPRSSSAGEVILLSAVAEPVAWSSGWNSGNRAAGFDDARTKRKPQPRAAPVFFASASWRGPLRRLLPTKGGARSTANSLARWTTGRSPGGSVRHASFAGRMRASARITSRRLSIVHSVASAGMTALPDTAAFVEAQQRVSLARRAGRPSLVGVRGDSDEPCGPGSTTAPARACPRRLRPARAGRRRRSCMPARCSRRRCRSGARPRPSSPADPRRL